MLRVPFAAILLAALAGCSAWNATKPSPTPSDPLVALYRVKFLAACETDGSPARLNFCQCTEDALEANFDIAELNALMKEPALRRQLTGISRACAKGAGLELRNSR